MEAIGLNPIRLDAIGIDPIRLNAIRLGVPGASSGSNRPYIDPEVLASLIAVVKCDGKSNNDPDRAIIKNLVDPDNPFVISNAAYKLNSGFGKYEVDFTQSSIWKPYKGVNVTPDKISLNSNFVSNNAWIIYKIADTFLNDFKVKISGIPDGGVLEYYTGGLLPIIKLKNGDNKLEFNGLTSISSTGFRIYSGSSLDWSKLVIEQIPSFQGAFYADGVNDMITSTKTMSEMLGGGNKCTVISFITHISGAGKYNFIGNSRIQVSDYAGQSFMAGCSSKSGEKIVELGDKEKIQAFQYTTFDSKLSIGSLETGLEISSYAYYGTFVFNKDSVPIDWIHQVIAYYNLDKYVKPDIYYDVKRQGLSNNTPDADWYLKDFSGNGRDMQLYNYGKTPESGINEEGGLQSDGITDYGKAENLPIYKDYTVVADREIVDGLINNADGGVATRGTKWDTGAFCFDYTDGVYSFGATNGYVDRVKPNRFISYMSKYIHNGITTPVGDAVDNNPLCIAKLGSSIDRYSKLVLWSFLLFPYSLSEFLLERQLKRYKLGTLYPDMVEFRPIVKSNVEYELISFATSTSLIDKIVTGDYMKLGTLYVYVKPKSDNDRVVDIRINGIPAKLEAIQTNGQFRFKGEVSKSPQKIDITIEEYIRYEDIVQPYPYIVKIRNNDGYIYTYGDKLKVGSEIIRGKVINLLPELYSVANGIFLNGQQITNSEATVVVSKNMVFSHGGNTYLKDNEPNCIADPQRLRIPNSSYKILGYIPDISGHGNHLKINNSAYAGMSGANGYKYDWSNWIKYADGKLSDNSFVMNTSATMATTKLFSPQSYAIGDKSYSFRFKISGLINNQRIEIDYPKDSDGNAITSDYLSNGEYYTKDYTTGEVQRLNFFLINANIGEPVNIKIEQIGEYEGSFCLDGVEDFITIPTLSHGAKQVLMKVRSLKPVCPIYEQRTLTGVDGSWVPTFCIFMNNQAIAYADGNNGNTYIDGILNTSIQGKQLVNITHNITVTNENTKFGNTQSPLIGKLATSDTLYAQMALFSFVSFDDISSEDEIKELNDIVGIEGGYVESPDYYFDAYGKSNNLDEDIDYQGSGTANTKGDIYDKSITGLQVLEDYRNGGSIVPVRNRQLTLNNFAFNEESGYGGWLGIGNLTTALNYGSNTTTNNWKRGGTFLKGRDRNNKTGCGYALANWFDNTNPILKFKIKITGLTDADELYICQYNIIDPEIKQQLFNGINEVTLDLSASIEPTYRYISFRYPPLTNDVDFEFLYEYQNGLVSDGVEDYLSNTAIPAFTDFTVIAKRTILDTPVNSAFCCKGEDYYTRAAFMLEFRGGSNEQVASFGTLVSSVNLPDLITFMTATSYNGRVIGKGTIEDTVGLWVGRYNAATFWKGVFYKAMLYSNTIDMLSINMLKNLFAKDELIDVNNPIFKK